MCVYLKSKCTGHDNKKLTYYLLILGDICDIAKQLLTSLGCRAVHR